MTSPAMPSFRGLSERLCSTAWDLVAPAVERAWASGLTERRAGCVVVLDEPLPGPTAARAAAPLFIGYVEEGEDPELYRVHALAKAEVSARTGLSSRGLQQQAPHLYRPGMTKWGGSVVRDGLVCAFSGVQPVFDEMIADWMAGAVISLCRHEMLRPGGVMDSDLSFLGS